MEAAEAAHRVWVAELGEDSPAAAFHGIRLVRCRIDCCCGLPRHAGAACWACRGACLAPGLSARPAPHACTQGMALTAAKRSEEAWPLLEKGLGVAVDNYNLHVSWACEGG